MGRKRERGHGSEISLLPFPKFTPIIIITFLHSLCSLSPSFFLFSFFFPFLSTEINLSPSWPGSVYYAEKISLSLLPSFFPSPSFFFFTSSSPNHHLKFSFFFPTSHLFIYLTFALSLSFFPLKYFLTMLAGVLRR